jgi:hypothetical protein
LILTGSSAAPTSVILLVVLSGLSRVGTVLAACGAAHAGARE